MMQRANTLTMARLRDVLDPFVHPRVSSRKPRPRPRDWPEHDRVLIEVDALDMLKLGVVAGTIDALTLRELPLAVRPSVQAIEELEELAEAVERANGRSERQTLRLLVDVLRQEAGQDGAHGFSPSLADSANWLERTLDAHEGRLPT